MNNRGQSLVLFVLLIPIIVGILAFVIDLGFMGIEKDKLNNLNTMAIEYGLEHIDNISIAELEEIILKNDKQIKIDTSITENGIVMILSKEVNSLFGNIINIKKYQIISKFKGKIVEGKIEIKRV